jgi:hypothetical protein
VIQLEGHAELLPSLVAQRCRSRGAVRPTLNCVCVTKSNSKISKPFYARLPLQQVYAVKNDMVNIGHFNSLYHTGRCIRANRCVIISLPERLSSDLLHILHTLGTYVAEKIRET